MKIDKLKELLSPQDFQLIVDTYASYELDWDKVFDFTYNLDVSNVKSVSSYRRGAIIRNIEEGKFIKIKNVVPTKQKINLQDLWEDLRLKGIRILGKSQYFINELEQYMYDRDINPYELKKINHQIVDCLKEGDTTEKLYFFLKNSHFVKDNNINIAEFEAQAEQEWADYEDMMNSLNSIPDIQINLDDPFYKCFEK